MENQLPNNLEEKIRNLSAVVAKLKQTNRWMAVFIILVVIIQVYNLISRWIG